jgi:hypothetical protein
MYLLLGVGCLQPHKQDISDICILAQHVNVISAHRKYIIDGNRAWMPQLHATQRVMLVLGGGSCERGQVG